MYQDVDTERCYCMYQDVDKERFYCMYQDVDTEDGRNLIIKLTLGLI
jgi:hypothetical protein